MTYDLRRTNPQALNTSKNLSLPVENKNTKHEPQLSEELLKRVKLFIYLKTFDFKIIFIYFI